MALAKKLIALLFLAATVVCMALNTVGVPTNETAIAQFDNWVAPPCDKVTCCEIQEYGHCTVGLWLSWKDEPMNAYIWDGACQYNISSSSRCQMNTRSNLISYRQDRRLLQGSRLR